MRFKFWVTACAALTLAACGQGKAPATDAAGASSSPPPVAVASVAGDPDAVILPLYQPYLKDDQTPPPDWRTAIPFTAATRALIDKEAAATAKTGEVGAIDGDPIIAAQDWKISNLQVAVQAPPADGKVVVEAKFHNLDQDTVVSWDMIEEAGAWHVANIREPEVDLVKLMTEATSTKP
ncbi:MAG: DUF3828 domain-containing protein [Alphaproteobacteria bacterium]